MSIIKQQTRLPFFYDTTLRDGNQALKKPWNTQEKTEIFNHLLELGVQAIEVGFAAASDMDYEACTTLSKIAGDKVVISALARAVESDILKAIESIQAANKKRIHTFIAMSEFNMKYVLNKTPNEVQKIAVEAVEFTKKQLGKSGEIQFSVEHFGDCRENLNFVIDTLKKVVRAGATTINLANTVERYRPQTFVKMVSKVYEALPKDIAIAVHCHNDLGMATAATIESYFAGATQLEGCINGLGERAGNTNLLEVAVALHNSDVEVPLNLGKIYETALTVAEMSKIPIFEKAPLIGPDALAHRSGIHQDGAVKTKDMEKGAYRPIHPSLIGRKDDAEKLEFTSQSGKTAVFEIISHAGYPITLQEAVRITPTIKEAAEKAGELPTRNIIDIYFREVFNVKGPFKLLAFDKINENQYNLKFNYNEQYFEVQGEGNGPLDCCLCALKKAGFEYKLAHYQQVALDEDILGAGATAMTVIKFALPNDKTVIARGKDDSTSNANVKAVFNGLNIIAKM